MTSKTQINGIDITTCPDTLAAANATIKEVVTKHNAACDIKIASRITNRAMVQVSIATAKGRAQKWLACHLVTNVQAFADGVMDAVKHATAGNGAPARDFAGHTDEALYFYGSIAAVRIIDAKA